MRLHEIVFPVFLLPRNYDYFYRDSKLIAQSKESQEEYTVDNKNLSPPTLGGRRLRMSKEGLFNLARAKMISSIEMFLKTVKGETRVIDNAGNYFKYVKTTVVPLTYHRVISERWVEGRGVYVELVGVACEHKLPWDTKGMIGKYVGMLHIYKDVLIPYELSDEPKDRTRRKV